MSAFLKSKKKKKKKLNKCLCEGTSMTAAHRFRFPSKGFIDLNPLAPSSPTVTRRPPLNHLQLCLRKNPGTRFAHWP